VGEDKKEAYVTPLGKEKREGLESKKKGGGIAKMCLSQEKKWKKGNKRGGGCKEDLTGQKQCKTKKGERPVPRVKKSS